MTNLERTKQGIISIEETSTLTDLDNEQIKLYDIDELLDYPVVEVDEFLEKLIRTGRPLINKFKATDKIIFKDKNLNILGIYQVENEELRCWKNFV
jgi:tRNA U55 pseudouridine synthase TruB